MFKGPETLPKQSYFSEILSIFFFTWLVLANCLKHWRHLDRFLATAPLQMLYINLTKCTHVYIYIYVCIYKHARFSRKSHNRQFTNWNKLWNQTFKQIFFFSYSFFVCSLCHIYCRAKIVELIQIQIALRHNSKMLFPVCDWRLGVLVHEVFFNEHKHITHIIAFIHIIDCAHRCTTIINISPK